MDARVGSNPTVPTRETQVKEPNLGPKAPEANVWGWRRLDLQSGSRRLQWSSSGPDAITTSAPPRLPPRDSEHALVPKNVFENAVQ
jgi:hypothetical protein